MAGNEMKFIYHYPKTKALSDVQKDYVQQSIHRFEEGVFAPDFRNTQGERYNEVADIATFVDFMLINELSKNSDGYKLSTYLHKDNDAADGRWKMGPIWDFDQTYGLSNVCSNFDPCGWTFLQNQDGCSDLNTMPLWWEHMAADTEFSNLLLERWSAHRQSFLHLDSINTWIDHWADSISAPRARNFERWPIIGTAVWEEPEPIKTSYEEEVAYMKNWIRMRIEWMDRNLMHLQSMLDAETKIHIYPNPARNTVNIVPLPGSTLHIVDLSGKTMWERTTCTEGMYTIDTSQWSIGCYIVYTRTDRGAFANKLIISN